MAELLLPPMHTHCGHSLEPLAEAELFILGSRAGSSGDTAAAGAAAAGAARCHNGCSCRGARGVHLRGQVVQQGAGMAAGRDRRYGGFEGGVPGG